MDTSEQDTETQNEAPDFLSQYEKKFPGLIKSITDGTFDIKEYYGISDDAVKGIYAIGYQMYNNKKYDIANTIFSLVSTIEPSGDYFYAQGASLFMLKNYDAALAVYGMAVLRGRYTPSVFEQMARCCAYLEKVDLLQKYAAEAVRLGKTEEFKNNKAEVHAAERSGLMLDRLNSLIEENASDIEKTSNEISK